MAQLDAGARSKPICSLRNGCFFTHLRDAFVLMVSGAASTATDRDRRWSHTHAHSRSGCCDRTCCHLSIDGEQMGNIAVTKAK